MNQSCEHQVFIGKMIFWEMEESPDVLVLPHLEISFERITVFPLELQLWVSPNK